MNKDNIRDDILVSVCLVKPSNKDNTKLCVSNLVEILKANFRYWELILVCDTHLSSDFEQMLAKSKNLRLFSVMPGLDMTQHRVIAAKEAIGDVVMLTSVQEVDQLDIVEMIIKAYGSDAVVVGERNVAALAEPLVLTLGKVSGFLASTRDMQTAALPRSILNRILRYPNPELSLRFMPRGSAIRVLRSKPAVKGGKSKYSSSPSIWITRLGLLTRMAIEAAPALLILVAVFSVLTFLGSILFSLYVVYVYFMFSDVAAGWTTLSLAISGAGCFLSCTLFAISISLRKLLEMARGQKVDFIISEKSSVDLFENVRSELNIHPSQTE